MFIVQLAVLVDVHRIYMHVIMIVFMLVWWYRLMNGILPIKYEWLSFTVIVSLTATFHSDTFVGWHYLFHFFFATNLPGVMYCSAQNIIWMMLFCLCQVCVFFILSFHNRAFLLTLQYQISVCGCNVWFIFIFIGLILLNLCNNLF